MKKGLSKFVERCQSNKFELEFIRVQQENALTLGNQKLDMVAIDALQRSSLRRLYINEGCYEESSQRVAEMGLL